MRHHCNDFGHALMTVSCICVWFKLYNKIKERNMFGEQVEEQEI